MNKPKVTPSGKWLINLNFKAFGFVMVLPRSGAHTYTVL